MKDLEFFLMVLVALVLLGFALWFTPQDTQGKVPYPEALYKTK